MTRSQFPSGVLGGADRPASRMRSVISRSWSCAGATTFNCAKVGGTPRMLTVVGSLHSRSKAHDDRKGTKPAATQMEAARASLVHRSKKLIRVNPVLRLSSIALVE